MSQSHLGLEKSLEGIELKATSFGFVSVTASGIKVSFYKL